VRLWEFAGICFYLLGAAAQFWVCQLFLHKSYSHSISGRTTESASHARHHRHLEKITSNDLLRKQTASTKQQRGIIFYKLFCTTYSLLPKLHHIYPLLYWDSTFFLEKIEQIWGFTGKRRLASSQTNLWGRKELEWPIANAAIQHKSWHMKIVSEEHDSGAWAAKNSLALPLQNLPRAPWPWSAPLTTHTAAAVTAGHLEVHVAEKNRFYLWKPVTSLCFDQAMKTRAVRR